MPAFSYREKAEVDEDAAADVGDGPGRRLTEGAVIFNGTFGWDKGHEAALWLSGTDRPVEQQVPRPWGMRCAGMVGPPRTGRDVAVRGQRWGRRACRPRRDFGFYSGSHEAPLRGLSSRLAPTVHLSSRLAIPQLQDPV